MKKLSVLAAILLLAVVSFAQPYTIQQYLSIKSAGSPDFSPDGKRIVYLTNTTGTSQVWAVDSAGGKPEQLTFFDDNVSFVRWLPDNSGIIFGMARGGNENTQFFWMTPKGDAIENLTDEPSVRHNFAGLSKDGKRIYYTSNKRNRNFFDAYSMDLESETETLLYKYDGNISVAAFNSSGTKLVISRSGIEKSLDNDLYLVDVKTGKETHLTPHEDASEFGNVEFLSDSLLMTTNDKREFEALVQMRPKNAAGDDWSASNLATSVVYGPNWDVGGVTLSNDSRMLAYTVNNDGFSELHIRKIETGGKPLITKIAKAHDQIKLPAQGIVGGTTFSKDGSTLAFSFSSPNSNGDVWIYDIKSKKLSQITQSDRAGIDPRTFISPELIKFKTFDGREIPAWYYKPASLKGGIAGFTTIEPDGTRISTYPGGLKVIVSIHGGPEGQSRPGFNPLFQYYLSRGYAVLDPNVRGSTGYGKTYTHLDDVEKREDSVKDIAAAHEWLTTKGGADAKRIAVMGGSYGGYMTMAAITLYPDLWAAAVNTVGIVNWETFLQNTSGYRRRQREVEYGRLDRDIDFLRRVSPIRKIDRIKTPLFVIHGKNDPRVPYTEAEQVVKALRDRNVVVEYKLYDDEGHGISKLKNRLELYPLVADFLDRNMKK
ncbi:MAG: S9 family peptidase [Acidobacteria bacterium]|nr:S9 family peptidase [Acidobacteriota bacterium]